MSNYSLIEEVWGSEFYGKTKKKKLSDPLCDLYAQSKMNDMQQSQIFQRSTLPLKDTQKKVSREPEKTIRDSIQHSLFEKQFDLTLPSMFADKCDKTEINESPNFENNNIIQEQKYIYDYDNDHDQNLITEEEQLNLSECTNDDFKENSEHFRHNLYEENQKDYMNNQTVKILDLILYIVSGIFLIFVLETFVKIGIHLQK